MRQRFNFIKTNEIEEDFEEEERVELETVIEDTDLEALEEKFENFLKGCGHDNVSVTLSLYGDDSMSNSTFSSYDNTEDLDDELQEDNVTQLNLNLQNKSYDETKPSDTE